MRFLAAIFLLLFALPAHAQSMLQNALVVPACGAQAYPAGPLTGLTMNPAGQLCLTGLSVTPPPTNSVAPVVSGTATVGSLLSSTTGTWTNSPTGYAYQWLRGGANISGATSSTYTTVSADGGSSVGTRVTATNAGGSNSALSNTIAIAALYSGPGDIVSGAKGWYGLRAYNGAYAATGGKAVNLRRASDNTACDFDVTPTGPLGSSDAGCSLGGGLTLAAFATQDATASCTIATATATCTGTSSTPHVGSTVTGAGVTQPCWVTATTISSGSGTATLAGGLGVGTTPCGTIGSATTLTFTYGLFVVTAYDQSGNTNNLTQATAATQPQLLPNCVNTLPCLDFFGYAAAQWIGTSSFPTAGAGSTSASIVGITTGTGGTNQTVLGTNASGAIITALHNTTNTGFLSCGTSAALTIADNVWHAVNVTCGLANAGVANIDGALTSSLNSGSSGKNAFVAWGGNTGGTQNFRGYSTEIGVWNLTAFTTGQMTSLCHSQYTYWGTSTSC